MLSLTEAEWAEKYTREAIDSVTHTPEHLCDTCYNGYCDYSTAAYPRHISSCGRYRKPTTIHIQIMQYETQGGLDQLFVCPICGGYITTLPFQSVEFKAHTLQCECTLCAYPFYIIDRKTGD